MPDTTLIPRPQTFDLLAQTRNPLAPVALAAGLDSSCEEVRSKCVKLLLARPEAIAHEAIVSRWNKLSAPTRAALSKNTFELLPASRTLLKQGTPAQQQSAMEAIGELDMTSALPDLIQLSLDKTNAVRENAMRTILALCERWGERARAGRDVPSVRSPMIDSLAKAIHDYAMHQNDELVDAWLSLVAWEDSAQRALINDPAHPAFRAIQSRFWHSRRPLVMQLLSGYLWRSSTPKSILSILCEREDAELAVCVASMLNDNLLTAAVRRLRELPQMASLNGLAVRPRGVSDEIQRRLWLMMAANSTTIEPVLSGAVAMSKLGTADGRRLAAEIVRSCRRTDLDGLIQYMQHAAANPDDKQCAGAHLHTIFGWLDGPSTVLQAAAKEFFADFTLQRFLDIIRQWPAPMCRVMAQIVKRMEPDVVPQVLKALESPAPKRRIMALQVIRLMELSGQIKDKLLPLVEDSRVEVRVPAIDLLAALGTPELYERLPELLNDPTTDVQDAALRAKRRLDRRRKAAATPIVVPAVQPTSGSETASC